MNRSAHLPLPAIDSKVKMVPLLPPASTSVGARICSGEVIVLGLSSLGFSSEGATVGSGAATVPNTSASMPSENEGISSLPSSGGVSAIRSIGATTSLARGMGPLSED